MGCQTTVILGDNLTFTVTTHDPDTGVLTDADSPPTYRVYEDETAAAILTGTMAKLNDANTTGFYSEQIACTAGNSFEINKSYNIYIEATVDSDTGGISYGFTAENVAAIVNAQVLDVLTVDTFAQPGQESPAATTTIMNMIRYLYKAFRNRITQTATTLSLYADNATTVDQKATVSDDGTTFDRNEIGSGP